MTAQPRGLCESRHLHNPSVIPSAARNLKTVSSKTTSCIPRFVPHRSQSHTINDQVAAALEFPKSAILPSGRGPLFTSVSPWPTSVSPWPTSASPWPPPLPVLPFPPSRPFTLSLSKGPVIPSPQSVIPAKAGLSAPVPNQLPPPFTLSLSKGPVIPSPQPVIPAKAGPSAHVHNQLPSVHNQFPPPFTLSLSKGLSKNPNKPTPRRAPTTLLRTQRKRTPCLKNSASKASQ